MRRGCYWLFFYATAIVPAALFGVSMAGIMVYEHDGGYGLRPSEYYTILRFWEAVSAIICGVPGFLLVGWYQLRRRRENEQDATTTRRTTDDEDETVWPPPPHE